MDRGDSLESCGLPLLLITTSALYNYMNTSEITDLLNNGKINLARGRLRLQTDRKNRKKTVVHLQQGTLHLQEMNVYH